jgi:hypothetical protein
MLAVYRDSCSELDFVANQEGMAPERWDARRTDQFEALKPGAQFRVGEPDKDVCDSDADVQLEHHHATARCRCAEGCKLFLDLAERTVCEATAIEHTHGVLLFASCRGGGVIQPGD